MPKEDLEAYLPKKQIKVSQHAISMKQFDNYIGGWYFDILYGRKNKDKGPLIGVYINGNSKYAWARKMKDRTELECNRIHASFIGWCRDNKVKVIKVRTDKELGMSNMVYVEQRIAKGEHHFLGPINGFASAVRRWAYRTYGQSFITVENVQHFIEHVWNKDIVKGTHTTRTEMLHDEALEEAYICKMLYINESKRLQRDELVREGVEVEMRHTDMKERNERRYGRLIAGKYKVVSTDNRNYVKVEDEKGKEKKFYYSQIARVDEESLQHSKEKSPKVFQVNDEMLENQENVEQSVHIEPIPEQAPTDVKQRALDYERELEGMRVDIINEVIEQLNERKEKDLEQGFKPLTRHTHLKEAYRKAKQNLSIDKNKYTLGYVDKKTKIRRLAKDIIKTIFDVVAPQNLKNTNADGLPTLKHGSMLYKKRRVLRNKISSLIEPTMLDD
jgi:hypothetical protein